MALVFAFRTRRTFSRIGSQCLQPVSHPTDRRTRGVRTAILIRGGIDNYAVTILGLQHPGAPDKQLVLATRPVELVTAYTSRTRTLIESNQTECLKGAISVLIADLKAKLTDWYSQLVKARGTHQRVYGDTTT